MNQLQKAVWLVTLSLCCIAQAQFAARPNIQVTGLGAIPTESNYVPNVVFCENGLASFEALKAQAVAARTFAYYKMNLQGFINDGTGDQVYSCGGGPSPIHFAAAAATEGEILYVEDTIAPGFGDVLIASFYVAGAIPTGPFDPNSPSAIPNAGDPDPTNTEQWVTYTFENGDFAGNNRGSPLGFQGTITNPNWPNRGAKSQNGADFFSDNSIHYTDILKYYYGADIQLRTADTIGTGVEFSEKILTDFDNYGQSFGGSVEGHEGYFQRALNFSGSTTANVALSQATRTSSEQQAGSDSQLIDIVYDESSGTDFLLRHLSGARFSEFDGSSNAGARVSNLQFESIGSVGFWLKTSDPGLQVTLAIDDPTTGDRGVFRDVIADNQWRRYQWFLDDSADWEAWSGVGGNGQIDQSRVTIDSIQFTGATDAQVYLDTVFWNPSAETLFADFNRDGEYSCADLDALVAEIVAGSNEALFDITGDGQVDGNDQLLWLAFAAVQNDLASPYLPGDANLDGEVNESDFDIWNTNRFSNTAAWCSGDFDHNGAVDLSDLNLWNENKFTSSGFLAVPEPQSAVFLCIGMAVILWRRMSTRC